MEQFHVVRHQTLADAALRGRGRGMQAPAQAHLAHYSAAAMQSGASGAPPRSPTSDVHTADQEPPPTALGGGNPVWYQKGGRGISL